MHRTPYLNLLDYPVQRRQSSPSAHHLQHILSSHSLPAVLKWKGSQGKAGKNSVRAVLSSSFSQTTEEKNNTSLPLQTPTSGSSFQAHNSHQPSPRRPAEEKWGKPKQPWKCSWETSPIYAYLLSMSHCRSLCTLVDPTGLYTRTKVST